jgi:hypothetical protein
VNPIAFEKEKQKDILVIKQVERKRKNIMLMERNFYKKEKK